MTYKRLFYLKYRLGIATEQLMHWYPNDRERVSEVALVEVPEKTLREVIPDKERLDRIIWLKKKFFSGGWIS